MRLSTGCGSLSPAQEPGSKIAPAPQNRPELSLGKVGVPASRGTQNHADPGRSFPKDATESSEVMQKWPDHRPTVDIWLLQKFSALLANKQKHTTPKANFGEPTGGERPGRMLSTSWDFSSE
ncbi:hypothetical protein TWF970_011298 [Orbilia oligospora]|uniref:Uncharacterized protein n=1 Tax=Orbilia oligospora TaxID=2813651 RepID=A0A7C8RC58_ORBOL|nr:hypothetical protein TWF970_011298 [Orbilia oligospora]